MARTLISAVLVVAAVQLSLIKSGHAFTSDTLIFPIGLGDTGRLAIPFGRNSSFQSSPYSSLPLKKRVLDWDTAVSDGEELMRDLAGPRTQTQWNTLAQLQANGWEIGEGEPEDDGITTNPYAATGGPYNDIHPDPNHPAQTVREADGWRMLAFQTQEFDNCWHTNNQPTIAQFKNVFNVPGRTIVGEYNFGPAYMLNTPDAIAYAQALNLPSYLTRPPEVRFYSDILFILWAFHAGGEASNLKYIFKKEISTPETIAIMNQASGQGELHTPWPGITFNKGTTQYKALLGTPHGKGIAHMLIGHPNELQGKDVVSITIFMTTTYADEPNLLFTLSG